ncbi:MAG: hypothetical protein U9Q69_00840 [Nanoarchaeota archaeon]|nr:hypothetical protein [Nanoarchaeota archaeon]
MNEKKLEKVALAVSLIGILLLMFVSANIKKDEMRIADINKSFLEEKVKVSGKVYDLIEKNDFFIFTLVDNKSIKVIGFKNGYLELYDGDHVLVEGMVTEYENILEIEANLIKLRSVS